MWKKYEKNKWWITIKQMLRIIHVWVWYNNFGQNCELIVNYLIDIYLSIFHLLYCIYEMIISILSFHKFILSFHTRYFVGLKRINKIISPYSSFTFYSNRIWKWIRSSPKPKLQIRSCPSLRPIYFYTHILTDILTHTHTHTRTHTHK